MSTPTAFSFGTGRRKTAVARVRLLPGDGGIVVNGKPLTEYFGTGAPTADVSLPFRVTGNKLQQKSYYRHSNYPGGLKEESLETLLARKPELVIERAVKGMLPRNRLGRAMIKKLKVYAGGEHPHAAQQPTAAEL